MPVVPELNDKDKKAEAKRKVGDLINQFQFYINFQYCSRPWRRNRQRRNGFKSDWNRNNSALRGKTRLTRPSPHSLNPCCEGASESKRLLCKSVCPSVCRSEYVSVTLNFFAHNCVEFAKLS